MKKMVTGPIVLLEDDRDDKEIIQEVLKELKVPNEVIWFEKAEDALDYLKRNDTQPYIILSDINLPGMGGVDFKKKIDHDKKLREKSIPFVFFSTSADKKHLNEAYLILNVQGYFKKENSYVETKNVLKIILEYWKVCKHPNSI